jgi:sugar/nucleoside kinase (ribokinase family)
VSNLRAIDYLVIGHVTHDKWPGGRYAVGGTASYAALTAAALGCQVGIVTSAGPEFDTSFLPPNVQIVIRAAPATTTFENQYINNHRQQFRYQIALPLTAEAVPDLWQRTPLVHVGPLTDACSPTVVEHFAPSVFVGVTPQGWMRRVNPDGQVVPTAWASANRLLPLASAVVLSIEDVGGDWETVFDYAARTRVLVVTHGWKGCHLFVEGERAYIPAPTVDEVDPTGAGDIFSAAFFFAMRGGAAPEQAARFATCIAAPSVTRRGLLAVPTAEDVAVCGSVKGEV